MVERFGQEIGLGGDDIESNLMEEGNFDQKVRLFEDGTKSTLMVESSEDKCSIKKLNSV